MITEILKQNRQEPSVIEEQILQLFALKLGLLDPLSNQGLRKFKQDILEYAKKEMPETMKELCTNWKLTPQVKKDLEAIFQNYFKSHKTTEE